MEHKDILAFVTESGFKTMTEIATHFKKENKEVLELNLTHLTNTSWLRKISVKIGENKEDLFYVPYHG
jgi:hypothetical protein